MNPPRWWPWRWTVDWTHHPRYKHRGEQAYWTKRGAYRAFRRLYP